MNYSLSLTRHAAETLQRHLLADRSREQMAITLCGVAQRRHELRLLVRDVILLPHDAFRRQSATSLELRADVQAFIHQRARQQGLIQVDWHTHPGSEGRVSFSPTDDSHEAAQAAYLAHRMAGIPYASVVLNDNGLDARLWLTRVSRGRGEGQADRLSYRPQAHPIDVVLLGDLQQRIPSSADGHAPAPDSQLSPIFDRQVRAFGADFQRRLGRLHVGVVGVGSLGGAVVDYLARLGVQDWTLIDNDTVELSNLNRLPNASVKDAQRRRPKVYVARSAIRQAHPRASVRALRRDVFDPLALHALKACDLIIVATDNHSSRLAVNRLAVQYLIPLAHVGFNITVDGDRQPSDVSGECALPDLGRWCLQCAGLIDPQQAGWELASPGQRDILRRRVYIADTPSPAVRHLDGVVAGLAAAEIHNLVSPFRPQQRYLVYDARRTELMPIGVTPSETCPVCSPDHGVLGLGDLAPLPDFRRAAHVRLPPIDIARAGNGDGMALQRSVAPG